MRKKLVPLQTKPEKWQLAHAQVAFDTAEAGEFGEVYLEAQRQQLLMALARELMGHLQMDRTTTEDGKTLLHVSIPVGPYVMGVAEEPEPDTWTESIYYQDERSNDVPGKN